ncbi:MAG: GNAT family N-acetyltransferase [Treponema sp.]|nr:GNAT family N-acetyltransferase [Treponema sp.]MCL2250509.1 GNAT family N-acetyltransferase [Treponema sp.]
MGIVNDTASKTSDFNFNHFGDIIIHENDIPDQFIDKLTGNNDYDKNERAIGFSFSPKFLSELMYSGFYITSDVMFRDIPIINNKNKRLTYIPLINIWKKQTVLFFNNIHISNSINRIKKEYELRVNYNFINVINNIRKYHGRIWITSPLKKTLIHLNKNKYKAKAVSFEVYKDGELIAGEIGIKTGNIYTSYTGYHTEPSSGSVQIALMLEYLRDHNYNFCNLGTDDSKKNNAYKLKFGAEYIDRTDFIKLWREGRN